MTVRIYKSTDASAPVLTGEVGKLVALLDACLVNGYGALAAAGWTKPFAGTNTAAYRNSTGTGTGFYLDVNDNGAGAGGAKEATMRGYETMSAIATGTGPFPTVAQSSFGTICRKSQTANATARPWLLLADETVFYLFTETDDVAVSPYSFTFCFGDFFSYKAVDPYRAIIIGRAAENSTQGGQDSLGKINNSLGAATYLTGVSTGHYIARAANGSGGSIEAGKFLSGPTTANGISTSGFPYPNNVNNGLFMSPVFIAHGDGLRGYLKGVWGPLHAIPITGGDTFSGAGTLVGKAFLAQGMATGVSTALGQIMLETSNTWT